MAADRNWWVPLALMFSALGWTWWSRVPSANGVEQLPNPREGFPAPEIQLRDLAGADRSLSRLRGQVVLVSFWASWCAPCRAEMPAMEKIYESFGKDGLAILAVNSTIQDSSEAARAFVVSEHLTFDTLLDVNGSASRTYLVGALPTNFVVDRRGVIRAQFVGGPTSQAVLQSLIQPLLHESP